MSMIIINCPFIPIIILSYGSLYELIDSVISSIKGPTESVQMYVVFIKALKCIALQRIDALFYKNYD